VNEVGRNFPQPLSATTSAATFGGDTIYNNHNTVYRTDVEYHLPKMVLAKSKKSVGLGNSLMNDRFGKGKNSEMHRGNLQAGAIQRTGQNGETVCCSLLGLKCFG
jgi:hypothetical protein